MFISNGIVVLVSMATLAVVMGTEAATTTANPGNLPKCDGPHETITQVGGGCYVDANGQQVCMPAKPPKCDCQSGYERNVDNKMCEQTKTSARAKRSTTSIPDKISLKDFCQGPHEYASGVGEACYTDEKGKLHCTPPPPPKCLCKKDYERNPGTMECEPKKAQ